MENNTEPRKLGDWHLLLLVSVIAVIIIASSVVYNVENFLPSDQVPSTRESQVMLVDGGSILPLEAEEKMLATLVSNGTINPAKLPEVTELNLLWAYGLANKNQVLESGPIMDARYGGPENMASVGGWSVAKGSVMDHYSMHDLATLTPDQQTLVEEMAKEIYRPCCNNSTHFPDCNHGMAMLGLLEYLASQGATEVEMWEAAMNANLSWFPDHYQTIAQYLKIKGVDEKLSPQILVGKEYSSGSGYQRALAVVQPTTTDGGGSCAV